MPMNLIAFYDETTGSVDVYRAMDAVYIDFSKPVDAVSYSILIAKWGSYGLDAFQKVSEKLAELSGSMNNDQWLEICMMASYKKHASEDNTGINTKETEHTLSKIRNNGMLGRGATGMLEGGGTTQRDLDRNLMKFMNRIEYFICYSQLMCGKLKSPIRTRREDKPGKRLGSPGGQEVEYNNNHILDCLRRSTVTKSRHVIIPFYSSKPHLKHCVLHCEYCVSTVSGQKWNNLVNQCMKQTLLNMQTEGLDGSLPHPTVRECKSRCVGLSCPYGLNHNKHISIKPVKSHSIGYGLVIHLCKVLLLWHQKKTARAEWESE
ncbi:LOW QUALITY PROTEIN: hypothetical protein QYF61_027077, partial [Mycteria americana]